MSSRGPPKHQNKFAWKPNAGVKINETEVGGKFRPYSEVTGVCARCKDQIEWKRKYGKYKPLTEPAKCDVRSELFVKLITIFARVSFHFSVNSSQIGSCAKEHKVCAKCSCQVDRIIGRDCSEVEAEQKMLEEAINNARERDRRTLLRTMNKGKSHSSTPAKSPTNNGTKAGELFPSESIDEYAELSRDDEDDNDSHDERSWDVNT
ncbi:hypothetical protein Acr_03g0016310 [Actinidia rufa]|uniref:Uncharacterized protein n=1 Tax=Actinidia rufa TaxID=165716 RepID=A0A7J0EGT9_9ERIC|nr:hypothetical protein Acr_03g0016310 [Actinidia rufa]